MLEIAPWGGNSLNDDNPDTPVRSLAFGPIHQGLITCLILEPLRRVDILDVLWLGCILENPDQRNTTTPQPGRETPQ